jgi:hypothetical protein
MPNVSADGNEIVFASSRGGNMDIWTATFDRSTGLWSSPVPVAAVNTAEPETRPSLSGNGVGCTSGAVRPPTSTSARGLRSTTEPPATPDKGRRSSSGGLLMSPADRRLGACCSDFDSDDQPARSGVRHEGAGRAFRLMRRRHQDTQEHHGTRCSDGVVAHTGFPGELFHASQPSSETETHGHSGRAEW